MSEIERILQDMRDTLTEISKTRASVAGRLAHIEKKLAELEMPLGKSPVVENSVPAGFTKRVM